MDDIERKRLYREHILDQVSAEYRDNPEDELIQIKLDAILKIHKIANFLEEEIRDIDVLIEEMEENE